VNLELNILINFARSLKSVVNEAEAARLIADFTFKIFKWDSFALYIYENKSGELLKAFETDNFPDRPRHSPLVELLPDVNILKSGKKILIPVRSSHLTKPYAKLYSGIGLPLFFSGKPLGVVFFSSISVPYTKSDVEKFDELCGLFTSVLARFSLQKELIHSDAKYFNIFNNSPTGIFQTNRLGKIIMANPAFVKMLGYENEAEVLDLNIEEDIYYNIKDRRKILANHLDNKCRFFDEISWVTKYGSLIWVQLTLNSYLDINGELFFEGFISDITNTKLIRTHIENSLKEKETLLKEVHHRVKNNLQIVSSLINLQSDLIDKKDAAELFRETRNRIKSMALIHELLYQSENFAVVNFRQYVENFVNYLLISYCIVPENTTVKMNVSNIFLGVDTAIPCGLILNEILSNAIVHNLNSSFKLEISIEMCEKNDNISLKIFDNGCSLRNNQIEPGLGLAIIQSLTEQINGKIEFFPDNGAMYCITFKNVK
jgi:PAS domain S-box-containing protein